MSLITAERYHDLSCGHRVAGHESKCAFLHGHNYRVHFTCQAEVLDAIGRVIDFSVIKSSLCMWLEEHWDHKFLAWTGDGFMSAIDRAMHSARNMNDDSDRACHSIVWVPFNPTAENLADHLLNVIGPQQLSGTGVQLVRVCIEETRKCSATVTKKTV